MTPIKASKSFDDYLKEQLQEPEVRRRVSRPRTGISGRKGDHPAAHGARPFPSGTGGEGTDGAAQYLSSRKRCEQSLIAVSPKGSWRARYRN